MMNQIAVQRFPITLREVEVIGVEDLSPRMRRIVLGGEQLGAFRKDGRELPAFQSLGPDDHVKLFFPDPRTSSIALPQQGDGRLHWPDDPPTISREYTPRAHDASSGRLILDFVLHDGGIAGGWAAGAQIGDRIHLAGPKASMLLPAAERYLLIGDETALPALANWLEMLPDTATVTAIILIGDEAARIPLKAPESAEIRWLLHDPGQTDVLVGLVRDEPLGQGVYLWAAAERKAVEALRAHLAPRKDEGGRFDVSTYWTLRMEQEMA
ncbi:siderophore-interacting protein [Shinella daejeonensis]|uniref:siderophore-interacting protein n=1 Tax=Shinella daejeonensis TaxID=659017 RepID=UPI0020C83251|nr:siderophore-interacting protein [Shinella daejeonensis]MCP8896217.1 siderophore-interacting protein [Shinella daejeonensis]